VHEKRYLGVAVHRAARICAAGYGGQVLLSETVRNLVEDEEDELPGIEFADLGAQRLKDFDRVVRVYQVVAAGLEREFPPLQTADRTPERGTTPFAPDEVLRIAEPGRRWRFSPRLAAIASTILVAGAIPLVWLLVGRGGESGPTLASAPANSVAVIDPGRNKLVAAVPVGARPTHIAVAPSGVWVVNDEDHTVSRIDPATNIVTRTIPVMGRFIAVAAGRDATWVVARRLSRIDTQFYDVTPFARLNSEAFSPVIALQGTSPWVADISRLARFTSTGARASPPLPLDFAPNDLAVGAGSIWLTGGFVGAPAEGTTLLSRVNPQTMSVAATAPIGDGASVVVGFGGVWVASASRDSVTRLDPETLTSIATIPLPAGSFPTDIATGEDAVWVVNRIAATVSRIDPDTNQLVNMIHVGGHPEGIAVGEGAVWVTIQ
jgi:YVTN family beta-propeller protein